MSNGYYNKNKPFVNSDGTVERPRPRPVVRTAAAPSSKIRNIMGAPQPTRSQQPQVQSKRPTQERIQTQPQGRRPYVRQEPLQPNARPRSGAGQTPYRQPRTGAGQVPHQQPRTGAGQVPRKRPVSERTRGRSSAQRQNGGWVIPEDSTVYTAYGRMYEKPRGSVSQKRASPQKKKRKKFSVSSVLWGLKVFAARLLICFVICTLCTFWLYRSQFYSSDGSKKYAVTYSIDNGSGEAFTADASSAYYNGALYVNFSAVSRWFNMAEVGSLDCMRFIAVGDSTGDSTGNGSEQYVIFTDNSRSASVNGSSVIMEARCRVIGKDIWIPLSFIENYIDGVATDHVSNDAVVFASTEWLDAVKENEKGKDKDKLKAEDFPIKVEFRLKRSDTLTGASYPG